MHYMYINTLYCCVIEKNVYFVIFCSRIDLKFCLRTHCTYYNNEN